MLMRVVIRVIGHKISFFFLIIPIRNCVFLLMLGKINYLSLPPPFIFHLQTHLKSDPWQALLCLDDILQISIVCVMFNSIHGKKK